MESVINHEYLNNYSEAYANRIVDRYFSENTIIDGENILALSEIHQINLLVVKHIMVKWQAEAKKIRSPFFDYSSPEVQDALIDFMNVLSKNISIEQKTFKPLLKMAVADVLMLIFSPYDFFSTELLNIGSPITLEELRKRKKFIKINNELFNTYINKIEEIGNDNLQIKEAKQYFDQVCEDINFSPEDPDEYVKLFSNEIKLEINKVYTEVNGQAKQENVSEDSGELRDDKVPIHEKFYEQKATLVDELKKDPVSTVLDYHKKQKIESIKKNISIQQRFRFVRELFEENDGSFNETIDFLDGCVENNAATIYLNERFFDTGKWNSEDEVVIEFISVIKKKFPD